MPHAQRIEGPGDLLVAPQRKHLIAAVQRRDQHVGDVGRRVRQRLGALRRIVCPGKDRLVARAGQQLLAPGPERPGQRKIVRHRRQAKAANAKAARAEPCRSGTVDRPHRKACGRRHIEQRPTAPQLQL